VKKVNGSVFLRNQNKKKKKNTGTGAKEKESGSNCSCPIEMNNVGALLPQVVESGVEG